MPKTKRVQCKICPAMLKAKFAASHAANHAARREEVGQ
jgi:hypothetical protein